MDAQNLSTEFDLDQSNVGLNVTDTSGQTHFLKINNSNVTSDLYEHTNPVRYKLTNMRAQITPPTAPPTSGTANLGQQNMQPPSPATAVPQQAHRMFEAPTNQESLIEYLNLEVILNFTIIDKDVRYPRLFIYCKNSDCLLLRIDSIIDFKQNEIETHSKFYRHANFYTLPLAIQKLL